MQPIRVLIIDDSAFMRKMITNFLTSDERIHVVGTGRNGQDGIEKVKELTPDVVTLDVEMPVMDGITTLMKIMETTPLPVVMVSGLTTQDATKTIQAISMGAVDFVAKPSGSISLDINKSKEEIIDKVITASQARVNKTKTIENNPLGRIKPQLHKETMVAIGTSTGGPKALEQTLTALPIDFSAPIFIVQHMPQGFTKSLADRLDSLTKIEVKEATHGEVIQKGVAYITPGDYHMKIRKIGTAFAIELTQERKFHGHRPAVDVLFHSIADVEMVNKIAVVLTGMGRDGAKGIKQIKEKDTQAIIISEAKESSIVYGMPAAAVDTGCVNQVVHLDVMGETINHLIK